MRNVRLQIAYDGSRFFGWQRQDGFTSVQQALEEAITSITRETVTVHGSGRTDTGVHALKQVAHVHVDTRLDDDRLRHALNAYLPVGVVVRRVETCRDDFHARYSAVSKRYMYLAATSRFEPAIGGPYCHWIKEELDFGAMKRAAALLVGRHDFKAFGNAGSPRPTTVRTIHGLRFIARKQRLAFVVQADGFLYNMVRTIAGTLFAVGRGRLSPESIARALASGDREEAGPTAPPNGLYLVSVQYPESIFTGSDSGMHGHPGVFRL